MPMHQKRSTGTDTYISSPTLLRSYSPNPMMSRITRRRHSTPHMSTKRLLEFKPLPSNAVLKYVHAYAPAPVHARALPLTRERYPTPNRTDLIKHRRRSRSLVRRYHPNDYHTHHAPSWLTSANTHVETKVPMVKKNLRHITEPSVTSLSDVPFIHHDLSPTKPCTTRYQLKTYNTDDNLCMSHEETLSENVSRQHTVHLHT
jgi:hypothetical protein